MDKASQAIVRDQQTETTNKNAKTYATRKHLGFTENENVRYTPL